MTQNTLFKSKTPLERLALLKTEWEALSNWELRYSQLIALGKNLPPLQESLKVEKNLVKGCQSQVWLVVRFEEGKLHLSGDSDALLVKGLVGLALEIFSESTPAEVLQVPADFPKQLGLEQNLSPNRSNGFRSLLKTVYQVAQVAQLTQKTKI